MLEEVRIDDLIILQRGFDITKKEQEEGVIPVISSGGISSYHNKYKVKGPGVIIGRKGTLGTVFFSENNYWPHDTALWVKNFKGNEPKFIYYLLQVLHFEKFDAGAANPTLNRNHVHSLKLKVPMKEFRSKIASILSAYDDLIENNTQRIKLLEEMAEEIYKEWFVRLRFPGYENTKVLDGMPDGWEEVKLNFFVSNIKKAYTENDSHLGIYDLSRIPRRGLHIPDFGNSNELESSRIIFNEDDILFGSIRPYFHKVSCANKKGITNVSVLVLRAKKEIYKSYALFSIFSDHFIRWTNAYSNGTKMPTISWNEVKNYPMLKPNENILESFYNKVNPFIKSIQLLSEKNQVLQQTRDLLLPRLINGKLSVENLNIDNTKEKEILNMAAEPKSNYQ